MARNCIFFSEQEYGNLEINFLYSCSIAFLLITCTTNYYNSPAITFSTVILRGDLQLLVTQ